MANGVRLLCVKCLSFILGQPSLCGNKDQTKGRIEEAKGKVKEVAGKLVGNDDLELKGKIQKSDGKVQAAYGDLKKDIKEASKGK